MTEEQINIRLKYAARKLAEVIADDLRLDAVPKGVKDVVVDIQEEELPSEVIPEIDLPDWATGETPAPAIEPEVVPDSDLESESASESET